VSPLFTPSHRGGAGAPLALLHALPWPSAAARYRRDWLPHADWVELEGVGHCPQLDVPVETAQLILGWTGL
jgi:pimeloyl-ACP methyl ester carboxylesterase